MKDSGQPRSARHAALLPDPEQPEPGRERQLTLGRMVEGKPSPGPVPADRRQKRTGEMRRDRLR